MNPALRNLLITVVVAAAAGAAGGWMGAEHADGGLLNTQPLRQSVHDIVHEYLRLSAQQAKEVEDIEDKYYQNRGLFRNDIAQANMELADALVADMSYGRQAHEAVMHVQEGLGKLQEATILYVLEVRDVLTPDQQKIYDRKVRAVLTAPEP